jgi:DNA polymerase-3 subunit alpha
LSGNPLAEYLDLLIAFTNIGIVSTGNQKFNQYNVGGRIFDVKVLYDKKNNPWSISRLECYNGLIVELFIFNDTYIKYKDFLMKDNIIYLEGQPSTKTDDDAFKIIVKKIFDISYINEKLVNNINIKISFNIQDDQILEQLYKAGEQFPGDCNLVFHVLNNQGETQKITSSNILIANNVECLEYLKTIIGKENVWLS